MLLAVCLTAVALVYSAWSYFSHVDDISEQALFEARTLYAEIIASWNYVDRVQDKINYNGDGTYDFKGVYCAIAGRDIARNFTLTTDGYVIRFVRENPRSSTDYPDEFESEALARFEAGEATECYTVEGSGDEASFRYVFVLTVQPGCLDCHGEPVGEPDETGFLKEGMRRGDVAGACSVTIPLASRYEAAREDALGTVGFFLVLLLALVAVVSLGIRRWVTGPVVERNVRLQSESDAKSNFLSIMSHELRTPLSAILAFVGLWEKESTGKTESEREIVSEIRQNSEVLLDMVNNTIDVAKLEAGRFELERGAVDMNDVLDAVRTVARPLAKAKGVDLSMRVADDVPVVMADWEAMRKILMNLVSNAVKYTDAGGRVEVAVEMDGPAEAGRPAEAVGAADADVPTDADGVMVVRVADTGVGIPEQDQEVIFERFSQGTDADRARKVHGSGLGLALCKSLAELQGGSISVKSEPGVGSTFEVRLPVEAAGEVDRA